VKSGIRKKSYIFIELIRLISATLIFLNLTYSQTKCDIREYYSEFIKIEKAKYGNQEYLVKHIIGMNSGKCFSGVVNNTMYIDYLLTNFSSDAN
jgi:hypothetical protein